MSNVQIQKSLLSLDEAAAVLGVSAQTVARLVKAGRLPSVKVGRYRRVCLTDVEAAATATLKRDAVASATKGGDV